ncbi:MAG: DUF1634 domain-containing protein, partial [Nitrososphaerota archaeon]|nr:DUF1634 domain-containing protein [Nitrososphaerota archaeon]
MNLKDPESMNVVIGKVLRYGVLLSAFVIIIGVLRLSASNGFSETSGLLAYNPNTIPHGTFDVSLSGFLGGLVRFDAFSLIELGAIILIATPVSRVLVSVLLFATEGERL